mmetsp:Transcript_53541/g.88799  ORF Transcript_53541/g.88799 Transcript_53541/m.88799 type:complete len:86 (+) Transcript_53541:1094-1351(+)
MQRVCWNTYKQKTTNKERKSKKKIFITKQENRKTRKNSREYMSFVDGIDDLLIDFIVFFFLFLNHDRFQFFVECSRWLSRNLMFG